MVCSLFACCLLSQVTGAGSGFTGRIIWFNWIISRWEDCLKGSIPKVCVVSHLYWYKREFILHVLIMHAQSTNKMMAEQPPLGKWEGILCEQKWDGAVDRLSCSNICSLIALSRNRVNIIQRNRKSSKVILESKQLVTTDLHIHSQDEPLAMS